MSRNFRAVPNKSEISGEIIHVVSNFLLFIPPKMLLQLLTNWQKAITNTRYSEEVTLPLSKTEAHLF